MNPKKRNKLTPAELERLEALVRIGKDPKASEERRLDANLELLSLIYEEPGTDLRTLQRLASHAFGPTAEPGVSATIMTPSAL